MKSELAGLAEKIAIVGMGFRWPGGVATCDELESFLDGNGDGIVDVPEDRWSRGRFYSSDKQAKGRTYVHRGGFLTHDVFALDPGPFNLSPRECLQLDPQQRLLLEVAWDAFDDAGLPIQNLKGSSTGVYVGGFMLDSRDLWGHLKNRDLVEGQTATGLGNTVLSNRISYTFDFHGPSMTVDTACSSSLVTLHLACRDLIDGSCDVALAGGVNVMLSPLSTLIMCKGQFLAADGRSKAFDAAADGYGRGEGAGLIVLKRLEDAQRDGDRIYAVILATGVNQDGRTDGMPLPNGGAQVALSRKVSSRAGIDPRRVGYVEAHGTGTKAGDTTEVAALAEVYGGPLRTSSLFVGSIKTNIGHTEAAAGIAGVIKTALSLYRGKIFPLRALERRNPAIDFDTARIVLPLESQPWPTGTDQTAAVNSFGYGGTNAHAVLASVEHCLSEGPADPAPQAPASPPIPRSYLLSLSAADETALKAQADQLRDLARAHLPELASSLARHRALLPQRAVIIAAHPADASRALADLAAGRESANIVRDRADVSQLCAVYTGMGPQWWGMGRDLLETEVVFREAAEEVDRLFVKSSGWSLLDEMKASEPTSKMSTNRVAQPANFLLQVALTHLLWDKGVRFAGYLGHSVGELTAAWAAGCLSLEQATLTAFHRSDIQQQVAGKGTMLAASISLEEAEALCQTFTDVSVAAINGAKSVALAGNRTQLEAIAEQLAAREVFARMMRVEVAYHSHHMDPLKEQFCTRLADLNPSEPHAPLFSTVLGGPVAGAIHNAGYFWQNARQPVQLRSALRSCFEAGFDGFLEIGPHPVLAGAIFSGAREAAVSAKCLSTLSRTESQSHAFDRALGALHCSGVELDWEQVVPRKGRIALPAYPFQRKHYWQESPQALEYRLGRAGAHPFLDQKIEGGALHFQTELDDTRFGWIAGHKIQGSKVFPGAAYLEVGFAVCQELGLKDWVLEEVEFRQALVLPSEGFARLDVQLTDEELTIASDVGDGYSVNAVLRVPRRAPHGPEARLDLTSATRDLVAVDVDAAYEKMARAGLDYGGEFRAITRLWQGEAQTLAELAAPSLEGYLLFPATLDAAFQSLLAARRLERAMVPVRVRSVRWLAPPLGDRLYALCRELPGATGSFDVHLFNAAGDPVAVVLGLVCAPVDKSDELRGAELEWLHRDLWVDAERTSTSQTRELCLSVRSPALAAELGRALKTAGVAFVEASGEHPAGRHVVFAKDTTGDLLATEAAQDFTSLLARLDSKSRVTVLTRGAQSPDREPSNPSQAALAGLARVAMTERPDLALRVIDLPDGPIPPQLLAGALLNVEEEEIVIRGERLLARRIARRPAQDAELLAARRPMRSDEAVELHAAKSGSIDSLIYRPRTYDDTLGPTDVEIDVECSSLNFKDLMKVMGLLGETALERTYLGTKLGIEAAGRALRVGQNVNHVRPGDRVVGFFGGALATKVRAAAHLTVVTGDALAPAHAASLLVYATAWHGLIERAQLKKGDRVLIHAATGGVGLAAVQIAQSVGAEIFATAGNAHKRSYLESLGVPHVYDSRTLDYPAEIRRQTSEKGVDVVLNSLAGEHLRQSLQLLAPGGRFIELGKQDFAENRSLSLLPFNRALSFHAVDLDRMSLETPEFFRPLVERVCRAFAEGVLSPMPTECFEPDRISEAFRRLTDAERLGKVVIDFRAGVSEVAPGHAERALFRRAGTYLIVGGLAGFGLRTSEWLLEQGVGKVVLASRRGKPSQSDERRLEQLGRLTQSEIELVALDATDAEAVSRLLSRLSQGELPLRGIFHAAAVLDDQPLHQLDEASWRNVMRAKALAAWNLHQASRSLALDHFVLFSSVSAFIGNPGQGAYAAANSFLDGLARLRRAQGLPALSVAWGAIADVGMLSRDNATESHLRSIGFASMKPHRALEALSVALSQGESEVGIMAADWARWQRQTPDTPWRRLALLNAKDETSTGNAFASEVLSLDAELRLPFITDTLARAVAPAFKMNVEDLDRDKPLRDLGLDSLLAVEVQARIEELTGIELSSMEILSGRPTSALAGLVASRIEEGSSEGAASPPAYSMTPGNLRDYFLERICVQPPYFSLENLQETRDGLTAEVRPESSPLLPHAFALAEAGRHLAILGSCAARSLLPENAGRIYYPVRQSRLLKSSLVALPPRAKLRARCTQFDPKMSTATAEAELLGEDGETLFAFEVTYHVIGEVDFKQLFAQHRQPTEEASGANPYEEFTLPRAELTGPGYFRGPREAVLPARCLGHFVDYPAYPVSIMLRDALAAAHAVICAEHGSQASYRLEGGTCTTSRFIFAGEEVQLVVRRQQATGRKETLLCELISASQVAAQFELRVAIERSEVPELDARRPERARVGSSNAER